MAVVKFQPQRTAGLNVVFVKIAMSNILAVTILDLAMCGGSDKSLLVASLKLFLVPTGALLLVLQRCWCGLFYKIVDIKFNFCTLIKTCRVRHLIFYLIYLFKFFF